MEKPDSVKKTDAGRKVGPEMEWGDERLDGPTEQEFKSEYYSFPSNPFEFELGDLVEVVNDSALDGVRLFVTGRFRDEHQESVYSLGVKSFQPYPVASVHERNLVSVKNQKTIEKDT